MACLLALVPVAGAHDADGAREGAGGDAREDAGCWEYVAVGEPRAAGIAIEHGTCTGESWSVAVNDPNGRSELRWYDDERGVGLEVHRPPRFIAWWTDAEGCHLIVYAFGAEELPCVAGDAPPPPAGLSLP